MISAEERDRQQEYADFAASLARPVDERLERGRLHIVKPVLVRGESS